ncbi:MAG: hypothetical protein ABIX00_07505 [Polaromonas sp.]
MFTRSPSLFGQLIWLALKQISPGHGMGGASGSGVHGLLLDSLKPWFQTINTAQVFKAVERDSSFFLANS